MWTHHPRRPWWSGSVFMVLLQLISATSRTRYCHLRSSASAICSDWHSTGTTLPDCNWTTKFRSQRTSHMEPSATSTTVTGPVGERLQANTEDAPVLDGPAQLRHLHDSGAGYKYPELPSFLAYTPNWPVALFLLLFHRPGTLYLLTFDCAKRFSLSNATWKPIYSNSLTPVLHKAPLYLRT